jgi:hypothetical protein
VLPKSSSRMGLTEVKKFQWFLMFCLTFVYVKFDVRKALKVFILHGLT